MSDLSEMVTDRALRLPELALVLNFHSLEVHDSNSIRGPAPDDMTLGVEATVLLSTGSGHHRRVVLGWWRKPKMDNFDQLEGAAIRIVEQIRCELCALIREGP